MLDPVAFRIYPAQLRRLRAGSLAALGGGLESLERLDREEDGYPSPFTG